MTRIEHLRTEAVARGNEFSFQWNGEKIRAYEGETILGALIAAGIHTLRHTDQHKEPRGMLCGMGVCFDCLVSVDGVAGIRACVTPARPDANVEPHELPPGLGTRGGS